MSVLELCFNPQASPKSKTHHSKPSWSPQINRRKQAREYSSEVYKKDPPDAYHVARHDDESVLGTTSNCERNDRSSSSSASSGFDVKGHDSRSNTDSHGGIREENISRRMEGFRSSMLWKDMDPNKLPSRNEVHPTFPPNRYQKGRDFTTQLFGTPVAPRRRPEFRVNLDVSHYDPDEIHISLENNYVVAEGKHYSESEFGYEACEFYRKYPVPEGIESSEISYRITDDGILVITGQALELVKRKDHGNDYRRRSLYDNVEPSQSENKSQQSAVVFEDFKLVGGLKYQLALDVTGYKADELAVRVLGKDLTVQGTQKVESNDGGEKRISTREFTKRYLLPADADVDSVSSRLTKDGKLRIQCVKRRSSDEKLHDQRL